MSLIELRNQILNMNKSKTNIMKNRIEQKGMTLDHDFGYSIPVFSFLLKKIEKKKRRMNNKNYDQKSCLSARSKTSN